MALTNSNTIVLRAVLIGTMTVVGLLLGLLLIHDITHGNTVRGRTYLLIGSLAYLTVAYFALVKNKPTTSGWMIFSFYSAVMTAMVLTWGVNAPMAILSVAFTIMLPGILFGPRPIIFVALGVVTVLIAAQTTHSLGVITPLTDDINVVATLWDTSAYIIVFLIFALLSWLSGSRTKATLERALHAESKLREQRDTIRAELENEYRRARKYKLEELERLYKFATLGQDTAATIHELSNHLSVLNMDIADLTQQHKNSEAITHAKESVDHINDMLRHIRHRLNNAQSSNATFSPAEATLTAAQDARRKFQQQDAQFDVHVDPKTKDTLVSGDPLSWSHITTILITNALEACQGLPNSHIKVHLTTDDDSLLLSVTDNGEGIPPSQRKTVFEPRQSSKPNGMGMGLYITKHIIGTQFNGTIRYAYTNPDRSEATSIAAGSKFTVAIPLSQGVA